MANIDSQINDRMAAYAGNPQALMQRYAQTQELVDLLALQKMKNDRTAATASVQSAMQPPAGTVKGQLEQEAMQGARNDVLRSMAPGIQQQGVRTAQMQNRAAMGIPTQPAPNMQFAGGGIVGYQQGGDVEGKNMQVPTTISENQRRAPYLGPEVEKFLVELEALNAQKDAAFPQEKDLFEQKIQDLISTTSPRVLRIASDSAFGLPKKSGMAAGGEVKRYQDGGLAALADDETRFGVTTDSGLTSEEARALDEERRDVGMAYGPFDFARDIRDIIRDLPAPQRIPREAILRRDMIDMTGAMAPSIQERRQADIERQISELPPEDRMPRKEAEARPLPQNEGITAAMYRGEPTNLEKLRSIMQQPRVDRKPEEKKGLDIDFRALREFLAGGAGQTSTAGALASGAKRLGAFQTAERTRQDEIQQQLAERQLERELADAEASQLVYKLSQDYRRSMDEAAYKVAQDELKALPLNPDYQREMQAAEKQYKRSPVELRVAKEAIRKRYVDAAVQAARIPAERLGSGLGAIAGDAGIVG